MTENYGESFADIPVAQGGQSGPLESLVYPLHLSIDVHEKILLALMLAIRRFSRRGKDWTKGERLQPDC
jgi:hypothetical protein